MTLWHKVLVAAGRRAGRRRRRLRRAGMRRRLAASESKEVVLVTHDSFAIPKQVKAAFEQESGLKLTILQGGDAGEMVNRALLTKGNPQGDVLFGIDNNLLSRALDEGLFEPYTAGRARSRRCALPDRSEPRGDADRPRRRLPQRRPEVVRLARDRTAADARRPHATRATASCSSSRTPPPRPPGSRSCSPRSRSSARAAGRTTGAGCGRTACSPSTAGKRRTRPASPVPAAARASARSSSPTPRARRQRSSSRRRRLTTAPTAVVADSCFRQIELAGVLDGARNEKGARDVHRLHARGAVPGSDAGEHVRAARARRDAASGARSGSTPSHRRIRSSCPRPRSAATAIAGSTSGHRSSCAETRPRSSPRSPSRRRSSRSSSHFHSPPSSSAA